MAVACTSRGGGTTDASGAAGTSGSAGTTGSAGTGEYVGCYADVPAGSKSCCDVPATDVGCADTPEKQLQGWCAGSAKANDATEGTYRRISGVCYDMSASCVYDGQGKLVAWQRCEGQPSARIGWPADCNECIHGGTKPDAASP